MSSQADIAHQLHFILKSSVFHLLIKIQLMNNQKSLSIAAIVMTVALVILIAIFPAQAAESEKRMALHDVMQQLGRDMQAVTGAISEENWGLVAQLAPKIGRHPEPPIAEKLRILAWLGTDAGKFRGFDGQVQDAATPMGEAATRGDGQEVIVAFSEMQQRCLSCHQEFRKPFQEHFYGKR